MATLFVMQGRDQGKRFDLPAELTLGRDGSNPIQLNDSEVSRRHAEIRKDEAGYVLVDLGSSNGTFVNAEQVTEQRCKPATASQIGRTLLLFTDADEHAAQQPRPRSRYRRPEPHADDSRIVKSVGHGRSSQMFRVPDPADSPWLARARSNLQIMYRTALAVSHTLDIDQLLHRIMELIFEWVEADRGCIMLVDHETGELDARRQPQPQRDRRPTSECAISRTILDYVMEHKEGVLTSDARDDAALEPRQQHRQARRPRGDLRPDARPLRHRGRDLYRHLHAARQAAARATPSTSSPKST